MLNLPKSFSIGFSPFSPCPRRIGCRVAIPITQTTGAKDGKSRPRRCDQSIAIFHRESDSMRAGLISDIVSFAEAKATHPDAVSDRFCSGRRSPADVRSSIPNASRFLLLPTPLRVPRLIDDDTTREISVGIDRSRFLLFQPINRALGIFVSFSVVISFSY